LWTEYAGGYSDMLAQRRGRDLEVATTARKMARSGSTNDGSKQASAVPQPRRKLSFKEKHALDALPDTMAKLEAEIAALSDRLADPNLFTSDPHAFTATSERLAAAQTELGVAEERWLELELLKEELGARE